MYIHTYMYNMPAMVAPMRASCGGSTASATVSAAASCWCSAPPLPPAQLCGWPRGGSWGCAAAVRGSAACHRVRSAAVGARRGKAVLPTQLAAAAAAAAVTAVVAAGLASAAAVAAMLAAAVTRAAVVQLGASGWSHVPAQHCEHEYFVDCLSQGLTVERLCCFVFASTNWGGPHNTLTCNFFA